MGLKGIFFDRDGTLIEDKGYVHKVEDLRLLPGAGEAISCLFKAQFLIFIVSNQSGIGRGFYSEKEAEALNEAMRCELEAEGGKIAAMRFCPHTPEDNCSCRKPKPGMILKLAEEFDLFLPESWTVGDRKSDVEAGLAAGTRVVLITHERPVLDAATMILTTH